MLIEPQVVIHTLKQLTAPATEKTILLNWLKAACLLQAQTVGKVVSAPLLDQLKQQLEPVLLCLARQDLLPQNRPWCQQLEQQISDFYQGISSVRGQSPEQLLRRWNHEAAAADTGPATETVALHQPRADGLPIPATTHPVAAAQADAGYSRYE